MIVYRKHALPHISDEDLVEMYKSGTSVAVISAIAEVPTSLINARLVGMGCAMRRHGGRVVRQHRRITALRSTV